MSRFVDVDAFKEWLLENSINEREVEESKQIGIWIDAFYSMQNEQSDCEDCIKHGGDWECDRVHCHKGDAISRQAVIEVLKDEWVGVPVYYLYGEDIFEYSKFRIESLPPVQLERDIPIKPIETTDKAWGIPHKQAVCPKCYYYLSHISFLGDYKGKRITYCETCGQAIDWEGWDWDE